MAKVTVLSPRGESYASKKAVHLAPRVDTLKGKSIYLVDNRRPNAQTLLDAIEKALVREHQPARITRIAKPSAGLPIDEATLKRMKEECDAVIEALCC